MVPSVRVLLAIVKNRVATMSLNNGSERIESKLSTARGLRSENVQLRHALMLAQEAASRCAIMLREADHRIKNSLQIVSSLMHLQADREQNLTARAALVTAATRIQSVARMHDALQASGGEDTVDLGAILEKMCESLHAMAADPLGVDVQVSAGAVRLPVAIAQPIVLAVNELVVNALRHAFPDGRAGVIHVSFASAGGQLRIVVADNGVGLPAGHAEGHGYGMKLVRMSASQIGGLLSVESEAGTRVTLVAPAPANTMTVAVENASLSNGSDLAMSAHC
jgi:two-component system, sensor histidine kinase PdtaS